LKHANPKKSREKSNFILFSSEKVGGPFILGTPIKFPNREFPIDEARKNRLHKGQWQPNGRPLFRVAMVTVLGWR